MLKGYTDKEISQHIGLSNASVGKWRRRYIAEGISGLTDAPRSRLPRTILDEKVAEILRLTLEKKPAKGTHWSTRSMAARVT